MLNDDWHGHPLFTSENGHFKTNIKNPYEEALFKCEEERYEFDRNIEVNLHTIGKLEPLLKKLSEMTPEAKQSYRIPLGYFESGIYARAIKRIYDRDRGLEVIDALHSSPAVAVPIILKRLKQKDEEWRRSQREWNKVWLEIEMKSFSKSLDYQSSSFKLSDKKALTTRALVAEIESVWREQQQQDQPQVQTEKSDVSSPARRFQFDFLFSTPAVQRDIRKLVVKSVRDSPAAEESLLNTKKSVNGFMRRFFGRFFLVGNEEFGDDDDDEFEEFFAPDANGNSNSNGVDLTRALSLKSGAETDTDDEGVANGSVSKSGGKNRGLRRAMMRKRMKENTEKSEKVYSAGTFAKRGEAPIKSVFAFYANSQLYALFRLYQVRVLADNLLDDVFSS